MMKIPIALVLTVALCGCGVSGHIESSPSAQPSSTTISMANGWAGSNNEQACYHATAPNLAELEMRVGPVHIVEQPEAAARYDDPDFLWYVADEANTPECYGIARTLKLAVSEALVHCTPEYRAAKERERRATEHKDDPEVPKRLPKYQKMLAQQKQQCGETR